MKNIQVIDGAENCTYDVIEATDDEFERIFPNGTDVEFVEDFVARVVDQVAEATVTPLWSRREVRSWCVGFTDALLPAEAEEEVPTKKADEMRNPPGRE